MVKNSFGGNKSKGYARKNTNVSNSSSKLRISEDEYEIYAQVVKNLGNGMCIVKTLTNEEMLCIIRGKFRGRQKKDNFIKNGSWVLVGIREWESQKTNALNKCDLLETYSNFDKDKLKNNVNVNWQPFINYDNSNSNSDLKDDDLIIFEDEQQEDYKKLIEQQILEENETGKKNTINLLSINDENDENEINIDDI